MNEKNETVGLYSTFLDQEITGYDINMTQIRQKATIATQDQIEFES